MKIVLINSVCGQGSTGRLVLDLAIEAEKCGHICYVAYAHGRTSYLHSYKIGTRIEHLFHNIFFTRILGLHGYGSIISTLRFIKWIDKISPDVVHIHNVHANYLNYNIFFSYLIKKKIKVIFTLHDCFNFTGKCTHFTIAKCNKWKSECGDCPIYRNTGVPSLFFDNSKKIYNEKRRLYQKINNMSVIAVSKWLKGEAEQSILGGYGHSIDYIYNWVDYSVFKPANKDQINALHLKYQLDESKKYLVSVSQEWNQKSTNYIDAISLSRKLPNDYKLLLVGRISRGTKIPEEIIHIPYISSKEELSILYSLAYAYIHFSIQDTFGLVIAEAMACGTIPITYNSTACAETPSEYGIVVPPRDIDSIVQSLPLIGLFLEKRTEMIEYVKLNFDKEINIRKYLSVYECTALNDRFGKNVL